MKFLDAFIRKKVDYPTLKEKVLLLDQSWSSEPISHRIYCGIYSGVYDEYLPGIKKAIRKLS